MSSPNVFLTQTSPSPPCSNITPLGLLVYHILSGYVPPYLAYKDGWGNRGYEVTMYKMECGMNNVDSHELGQVCMYVCMFWWERGDVEMHILIIQGFF